MPQKFVSLDTLPCRSFFKIIALTASPFEVQQADALSSGCDEFLRKPASEAEIFEIIGKYLEVQYAYEIDSGEAESPGHRQKVQLDTLKLQLAELPFDLLVRLKEVVELSDMEMIDRAVAEIHTHNPILGDALTRMVNDFQYAQILTLLQEVGSNK